MTVLADWLVRQAPAWLDGSRPLTPTQRRALHAILRCRTPALGGCVYRCTSCEETDFAYHSCHHRACPRCGGARTAKWTAKQQAQLLPVEYFLVTFTVPEDVRFAFNARPQLLHDLLFESARSALQSIAAQPRHLGGELGMIAVLHTCGRQLQHHPHLHVIVPGGALRPDGKKWLPARAGHWLLPQEPVMAAFRRGFNDALQAAAPDLHAQSLTPSGAVAGGFTLRPRVRVKTLSATSRATFHALRSVTSASSQPTIIPSPLVIPIQPPSNAGSARSPPIPSCAATSSTSFRPASTASGTTVGCTLPLAPGA